MRSPIAFAVALLIAASPVAARDVGGTVIPDTVTVAGAPKPLVLNGAGVRKKLFVEVYVGALYTAQPIGQLERLLDATTPRVMRLQFLRDVAAGKLADAWTDGIGANHSNFEIQALRGRLTDFNGLMRDVKRGDVLRIDLLPGGSTQVAFNDQKRGSVDGADFQRALLKVWLGNKPADADLKRALLAAGK